MVPQILSQTKSHHHNTGSHQSSPPPSVILKSSIPLVQGTTHEVGYDRSGNGGYYVSRSIRGNQILHLKNWHIWPTQKIHGPMIISLAPSRTTCLGTLVWGSMLVAVNIPLTRATVLTTFLGGSCMLGKNNWYETKGEKGQTRGAQKKVKYWGGRCGRWAIWWRSRRWWFLKVGHKSQLSDDPPWNYIGTSHLAYD